MTSLKIVDMPDCFGTYEEGHPLCNGDENASNALEKKPCAVRGECREYESKQRQQEGAAPKVTRARKRKPRVAPTDKAAKLYDEFRERLSKEAKLPWAPPVQSPVPGQLVSAQCDRYFAINARDDDLTPIARVYLRKRDDRLCVAFPAPADVVRYVARVSGFVIGKVSNHKSGVFACRTEFLDRAGVSACARLAAKLYARRRASDGDA